MINDLYPTIKQLNKSDKIRLLQYLVTEIAEEESRNITSEDQEFWLNAVSPSLQSIWDHPDEDIYNELTLNMMLF